MCDKRWSKIIYQRKKTNGRTLGYDENRNSKQRKRSSSDLKRCLSTWEVPGLGLFTLYIPGRKINHTCVAQVVILKVGHSVSHRTVNTATRVRRWIVNTKILYPTKQYWLCYGVFITCLVFVQKLEGLP